MSATTSSRSPALQLSRRPSDSGEGVAKQQRVSQPGIEVPSDNSDHSKAESLRGTERMGPFLQRSPTHSVEKSRTLDLLSSALPQCSANHDDHALIQCNLGEYPAAFRCRSIDMSTMRAAIHDANAIRWPTRCDSAIIHFVSACLVPRLGHLRAYGGALRLKTLGDDMSAKIISRRHPVSGTSENEYKR